MKKYDVYGLGNALVDINIDVSDQFLKDLNLAKGGMTLVDEDVQNKILQKIENISSERAGGGSAANTMLTISLLGGKGFYSCKVAQDEWGRFFKDDLHKNGLEINNEYKDQENGHLQTGKCLVMVTPDGQRTMNTFLGITQFFGVNEICAEKLANAEYLYIEGYLLAAPKAQEAISHSLEMARTHQVKKSITFSDKFITEQFRGELDKVINQGMDLIFCNEDEAKSYTQTDDLETAKERLTKVCKSFVITLGADGALLYDGKEYQKISGRKVQAQDTTGAGDSFAGAFLYGITNGHDFKKAGEMAIMASSYVVSRFGPRLTKEEVEKVLK